MASLPKTGTVTYEEWLRMPVVECGREEVVDGAIRVLPPNKSPHAQVMRVRQAMFLRQLDLETAEFFASTFGLVFRREPHGKLPHTAILAEGILKPRHFPAVQIDIAQIWPD